MERRPGPIIRPASPRRPTRQQVARRRAFVAIVVVVALFLVWQFWPAGGKGTEATGPSKPGKGNGGGQGNGNGHVGVIVPGENPIKHVIFIVKENRTFDHYFGTYPGADGATEGGTLECTDSGCVPGPDVPLKPAPYIQPHDITHGFSSGLYAINGGAMNGFNIIGAGQDLSGYVQHSRKTLPELLGVRRPVRARRPLLHLDVRADVPRAPLHGGRAVVRHHRQQDERRHDRQLLRRPARVHEAVPDERAVRRRHVADHEARGGHHEADPRPALPHRELLGGHAHLYQHQGAPRRARGRRDQLEVLRAARRLDERPAVDPPRPLRTDVEQGGGSRRVHRRRPGGQAPRGVLADPARGAERASRARA